MAYSLVKLERSHSLTLPTDNALFFFSRRQCPLGLDTECNDIEAGSTPLRNTNNQLLKDKAKAASAVAREASSFAAAGAKTVFASVGTNDDDRRSLSGLASCTEY